MGLAKFRRHEPTSGYTNVSVIKSNLRQNNDFIDLTNRRIAINDNQISITQEKNMKPEDLIVLMIDFVEENWSAFLNRAVERDYTEEEIEQALEKLIKSR